MICDTRRTLLRGIAGLDLGETPRGRKASKITPKHIVQTPPYGANDLITEDALLMVFDYVP